MAKKTIHIVKDTYCSLCFYVSEEPYDNFPFTLEIQRPEIKPMNINIDPEEYDKLIEALIKYRIIKFPEKEFKCMLSN